MSLDVTSSPVSSGYEDIDRLTNKQNELSNKMYENQQGIVKSQTEQNVADIERNKQKLEEETTKANKGLYADYMKQVNPYGATSEGLVSNGLGNSGVAESSKTNLYNTYQRNRTDTLNNAKSLYADYNNQIAKARLSGDLQLAQFAQEMYTQQMNNLYTNYQLMQNKEQFNYQKERDRVSDDRWRQEFDYQQNRDLVSDNQWQQQFDYNVNRDNIADNQWREQFDYNKAVDDRNYNYQVGRDQIADSQWQKQYDYNKYVDDRNYNYQVGRDKVADSQWQQEYNLSKQNSSSARKRSSGGSSGNLTVKNGNGDNNNGGNNGGNNGDLPNAMVNGALINGAVSALQNPHETILYSLSDKVKRGEITEKEANRILDSVNWRN